MDAPKKAAPNCDFVGPLSEVDFSGRPTGLDAADIMGAHSSNPEKQREQELACLANRPPKNDPGGNIMVIMRPGDWAPPDAALTRMRRKAYLAALKRKDNVEINKIGQAAMMSAPPFLMAALTGDAEEVSRLLREEPANARFADESTGQSALTWSSHASIFRLLLDAPEIDVNHADLSGETALFRSCDRNNAARIRLLLEMPGVDVNIVDIWGETALHHAAHRGYLVAVQLLLTSPDIDLTIRSADGNSACDTAIQHGFGQVARHIDPFPRKVVEQGAIAGPTEAGQTCPICLDFECHRLNSSVFFCCGGAICWPCHTDMYGVASRSYGRGPRRVIST